MVRQMVIGGVPCALWGDPAAEALLIQPMDEQELTALKAEADLISGMTDCPFLLAGFAVANWNDDLSPWRAPAVFGRQDFGGKAAGTLDFVLRGLLPALSEARPSGGRILLGGYSLAGLFALWASTVTGRFDAVAAVSPSVWYPDWLTYVRAHPIRAKRVYLSLGDAEERARNPVMARVGDAIRAQYDMLEGAVPCTLEWNPGNHFREPEKRTAKGFAWCLEA